MEPWVKIKYIDKDCNVKSTECFPSRLLHKYEWMKDVYIGVHVYTTDGDFLKVL